MAFALSWKSEDESGEGEAIGPVWLWSGTIRVSGSFEDLGWMAESQAKALAGERG